MKPNTLQQLIFSITLAFCNAALGQDEPEIDFVRDVKPVLEFNCVSCHREDNAKGKLRLDTKEHAFKSKDVLTPGDPESSSLYWMTTLPTEDDEIMPPIKNEEKDYPLTKAEQEILKKWIKEGANWPEGTILKPQKRLPKKIDFAEHVQPILEIHCLKCHREDKADGKLRLDTFEHAFAKEDVIVPGDPVASDLWFLATLPMGDEDRMPPEKNPPPTPAELFMLRRWIEEGADWPENATLKPRKAKVTVIGLMAKELYEQLEFKPGASQDDFDAYKEDVTTSEVSFDMVPVKGGVFTMGSSKDDPERAPNEHLAQKVRVSDFWMGKHEVTWDEYELWMLNLDKDNRKYRKLETTEADVLSDAVTKPTAPYTDMTFGMGKSGFPAICMTQLSAKMYCMWLSARTGKFYRLPTEAEWEYACKAGTTTPYSFGKTKNDLSKHSWNLVNSRFKYQKVGLKPPNPFGLHDMHGNIWEWVLDQYYPPAQKAPSSLSINPVVAPNTEYDRTVKGGSWDDGPKMHRSTSRMASRKAWKQSDPQIPQSVWYLTDALFVGFRVVRPREMPTVKDLEKYWPTDEDIKNIPTR